MKEQLGAVLESAMENSAKALLNTYEWKMPKKLDASGNYTQETIKLINAKDEQLKDFLLHCLTMLHNTDSKFPGRKVLLKIIEEQRQKCNAELFFRDYTKDGDRLHLIVEPIKHYLENNNLVGNVINDLKITDVIDNVPQQYVDLPLNVVISAGEKRLGLYDRTYMTLTFLLNKGIALSESERDRYSDYSESEIIESILEEIKLRNTSIPLSFKNSTGLSISQLQYLLPLKKQRYTELPTDILVLLRDKLLVYLENDIKFHIGQWEERINQIEAVAKERGLNL